MNSKNIAAIKNEKISCTCMKCLRECEDTNIHYIHIPQKGFGSSFDGFDTVVILCDDCYKESIKDNLDLWNMKVKFVSIYNDISMNGSSNNKEFDKENVLTLNESNLYIDFENCIIYDDFEYDFYEYEKEMLDYIHLLPIQSQELIYNRLDYGVHASRKVDPQEWIDYELEELPDELCKKNGWRTITEINEFREKHKKEGYKIIRQ